MINGNMEKVVLINGRFDEKMLEEKTVEFQNIINECEQIYLHNSNCKFDHMCKNMPSVKIIISSWGGYVDVLAALLSQIEIIKSYGVLVTTVCNFAYSCGFVLFLAGDLRTFGDKRFSKLLWHQMKIGSQYQDVSKAYISVEDSKEDMRIQNEYFIERTKVTEEILKEHYHEDWVIRYDDAVKLGIVQEDIEETQWYKTMTTETEEVNEEVKLSDLVKELTEEGYTVVNDLKEHKEKKKTKKENK